MKICWDNLENVRLTKNGNFRKNDGPLYLITCRTCGEECFTYSKSKGKFCSHECKMKGDNNHQWQGGIFVKNKKAYRKKYNKEYRKNNRESVIEGCKKWRENNPEKVSNYNKEYLKNNYGVKLAIVARRRARKLNQTPLKVDQNRVNTIYDLCHKLNKAAGRVAFHVDHIVPLSRGGLHHQDNLQILTAEQNLKKGNKI